MWVIFFSLGITVLLTWVLSFLVLAWSPSAQPLQSLKGSPPLPARSKNFNHVLLVVAHPDDESMFFVPTLVSLASLGCYYVRILCLSNGNAEGLGAIREQEMLRACSLLKVPKENVEILDDPALQDGHNVNWRPSLISDLLEKTATKHSIDTIITFDSYGISGHPNHAAVHRGVCEFLLDCARSTRQHDLGCVEAWQLESVDFVKKYSGPIYAAGLMLRSRITDGTHRFYNRAPRLSIDAMQKHATQWLWYRRLFVMFSHYSYMNTLRRFPT